MGHLVNSKQEVYQALAERLSQNPIGVVINEPLMEILYRLYTENEARVGGKFSLAPMTLDEVVAATGLNRDELATTLDNMANKGLVVDLPKREGTLYVLSPMIIGFFEFTFMRIREELNLKEMTELFHRYFSLPEAGMELIGSETKIFQTLVFESVIPAAIDTEVMDYERASEAIRQSGGGALTLCACRHTASHEGRACSAPLEVCTSLGEMAEFVVRRGFGKKASVDELLRVLDRTQKLGLVHLADNVLRQPGYICHCCGCCCGALRPTREFGAFFTHPSNFLSVVVDDECADCGLCAERCPVRAIVMTEGNGGPGKPKIDERRCIGCGVCADACPNEALRMNRRAVIHTPPANKVEQLTRIAKEKGRTYTGIGPL